MRDTIYLEVAELHRSYTLKLPNIFRIFSVTIWCKLGNLGTLQTDN